MSDATCEIWVTPRSVPYCNGMKTEPERDIPFQTCLSNSSTPAPTPAWEKGYGAFIHGSDDDGRSPLRGPLLLPGAWAIGEGMLVDFDEPSLSTSRPTPSWCSAAAAGSPSGSTGVGGYDGSSSPGLPQYSSLSRMAGSLSATMGTYLASLATAMASCSAASSVHGTASRRGALGGSPVNSSRPSGCRRSLDVNYGVVIAPPGIAHASMKED